MNWLQLAGIAAGASLLARRPAGIGAIVPDKCVGVTQCADGTWSTLPADRRGVCNRHGGVAEGLRRRVVKEETGEVVDVIEVINDQGQPADVVEVPVIGYYEFTTYTTRKGKTKPAIHIRFQKKPSEHILTILRNSQFWWDSRAKVWYGWETPENMEVVESLPIALQGETAPVVTEQEIEEEKAIVRESTTTLPEAVPFKLDPPERGKLYSNKEYSALKVKLWSQSIRGQRDMEKLFPEIRALYQEIIDFDNWGVQNVPKWGVLFSDQPGFMGSVSTHLHSRGNSHPYSLLHHHIQIAADDFRNAYDLSKEKFNEYRNRNYQAVQQFFTDRLSQAVAAVRKQIQLLQDPFWYSPDVDPQAKIDAKKISTGLMERILYVIHGIDADEHWIRNMEFKGRRFSKYSVLDGSIRLEDYLAAVKAKKQQYAENNDKSALRLKKQVGELWQFNKYYLEKGYSFHLPTYSRKLRENGVGYIANKQQYAGRRAYESYIEIVMDSEGGYRIMLSTVPGYEVESALIATNVLNECFKGKMKHDEIVFKCYDRMRTYREVEKYLDSEEPIHLLYGLEPAIKGFHGFYSISRPTQAFYI